MFELYLIDCIQFNRLYKESLDRKEHSSKTVVKIKIIFLENSPSLATLDLHLLYQPKVLLYLESFVSDHHLLV